MLAHPRRFSDVATLSALLLLPVAAAVGASGCLGPRQGPPDAGRAPEATDAALSEGPLGHFEIRLVAAEDGALDFSTRVVGSARVLRVTAVNAGMGTARFRTVDSVFATPFRWTDPVPGDWISLPPGGEADLAIEFAPREPGKFSATMVIALEQVDNGRTAAQPVRGIGLAGCPTISPSAIDFGEVDPVRGASDLQVTIAGPAGVPDQSVRLVIEGDNEFRLAGGGRTVIFELAPDGSGASAVEFAAKDHNGTFTGSLVMDSGDGCDPQTVPLKASVIQSMVNCGDYLTCDLDFGAIQLGDVAETTNRILHNDSFAAVKLTDVAIDPPGPFTVLAPEAGTRIEPSRSVDLRVRFQPTSLGHANATLLISADDSVEPRKVTLTGLGGGPKAQLSPATVDAGSIRLGESKVITVTLANVGAEFANSNDGLLELRGGYYSGGERRAVQVAWPPEGLPFEGLAVGASVRFTVTLTPVVIAPISGSFGIGSNATNQPISLAINATVHRGCQARVDPRLVSFGMVEPGMALGAELEIRNDDSQGPVEDCTLTQLGLSPATPAAFSLLDGPSAPVTLASGERLRLHLRAAPDIDGPLQGALQLDASGTAVSVPMQVDAMVSCLATVDRDVDFGTAETGCSSAQRTVTIHNGCARIVRLTGIVIEGASPALAVQPPSASSVAMGGALQIPVFYSPSAAGDDSGTLAITSDEGVTRIPVHGVAQTGAIEVEQFVVPDTLDVLAVVDQSTSMASYGQSVATQAIDAIETELTTAGLDWRIGTVPDAGGRLQTIASSASTRTLVLPPGFPAVSEDYLDVARQALTYPLSLGHNAGFLRADAPLAVLVVGDAADRQSPSGEYYAALYSNRKPRPGRAAVFAVVPTLAAAPSGCSYDGVGAGQATLVRAAVQSSGGAIEEFCAPDASRLAKAIASLARRFALRGIPDLTVATGLVVDVNGAPMSSLGSHGRNWSYDAIRNEVVFEPSAGLAAGDVVRVSFAPKCQ